MRLLKYSGISWYGDIPSTWTIAKIKDIFSVISGSTPDSNNMSYWDGDIRWITPADYKTGDKYVSKGRKYISQNGYDSCGTTMIPEGSIIFSKRAPIGSVAINTAPLCTNQGCLSCIPNNATSSLYYYYVMSVLTEAFELYGSGTTFKEISAKDFSNFHIPFPPYNEQHRIADFLDRKCAVIDNVLNKTNASLEEYKKLKQSVITEAVTKGIRSDRPMKDSGIEWIGRIAKDFHVWRMKHLLSSPLQYGASESGIPYEEHLPRYIRITDITTEGKLKESGRLSLTEASAQGFILSNDDILFARSGATVGKAFQYKVQYGKCAFAGYLIKAVFDQQMILPAYVFYYTQSSLYEEWKSQIFVQATIQNIGADKYYELPIVKPNVVEQQEIVSYLDLKCAEIDSLIASKEKFITELESYKKSLIYEYVTGKKEVPSNV